MANLKSISPVSTDAEKQKLRKTVETMDELSQDGFSAISTLAKLTLERLETPAGHQHIDDIAKVLKLIWEKAEDIQNSINCEAEDVGCNYENAAQRRRWDAQRQMFEGRQARTEVQHG